MDHPYGWLSLLPPILAVVLAIATRRVVLSLLLGIFAGAIVTCGGNVFGAIQSTCETHLWQTLIDPGKLRVFAFTLLMGAMVGVINASGGMTGLVDLLKPLARTRRSGQLTTWFLGLLIFFDDYANTMLIGNTLRPVCDRLKISREKLAYLVDSTAAPVAGLAIISTWIAFELDVIQDGVAGAGLDWSAFSLFIASIPYRFYVLVALLMVPLVAITQRDFGPMLKAERDCVAGLGSSTGDSSEDTGLQQTDAPPRWFNAVIPIGLTLAVVLWIIFQTGRAGAGDADGAAPSLMEIFGNADSTIALMYGGLVGLLSAGGLAFMQRILPYDQIVRAAGSGARVVLPAIFILWMASTMSRMTSNKPHEGDKLESAFPYQQHRLYTGEFLQTVLVNDGESAEESAASAKMLPTVVFLLASVIAFCTGTSFGTMGILTPMVIPLGYALLESNGVAPGADHPVLLASIGSVLAGAVFGDHCSPISDTTVLSSQSSGCDHIAHVWTQMPYAVAAAAVAVCLGTLPIGWGVSVWVLLPLQVVALVGILFLFGSRADG